MRLAFALFFIALFGLLALANRFVHQRAARAFRLEPAARRALAVAQALALAALCFGRALSRVIPGGAAAAVAGAGWLVELAVVLAAALLLVARVAEAVAALSRPPPVTRESMESKPRLPAAPGPDLRVSKIVALSAGGSVSGGVAGTARAEISRREVLTTGTALAAGAGAAALGWLDRRAFEVEEVPIRLAKLPRALDGFTIAQLSDLHVGLFVGERELLRAVELVRSARPNLIAITGDMLDADPALAGTLGGLVRSLGQLAPVAVVPGNHDYYAGIGACLAAVRRAGAEVLLNRSSRIAEGRIALAGVDDLWARRFGGGPDLPRALAGVPDDMPRVLLAHQPAVFADAAAMIDLQLSGHTHGGQFNPVIRPAALLLPHGWIAGRYALAGAQLYVNRGFGTAGPPARLGSAPEVTRIVLTCA